MQVLERDCAYIPPVTTRDTFDEIDLRADLERAIARLGPYEQFLVFAVYYQEIPLSDLADRMGVTYQAIQGQVGRITNQLRREISA